MGRTSAMYCRMCGRGIAGRGGKMGVGGDMVEPGWRGGLDLLPKSLYLIISKVISLKLKGAVKLELVPFQGGTWVPINKGLFDKAHKLKCVLCSSSVNLPLPTSKPN